MGWWDLFLKLVLRESPQHFIEWLLPGAIFIGWRDGQFQKRGLGRSKKALFAHEIRADSMMEVRYKGRRCLIHVEFQSTRDPKIGYRLLGYSYGAVGLHELPVLSYVIYVRAISQPPASPYEWPGVDEDVQMGFKYRSIELAELPVEELEQKHLAGLAPLLLLAKNGATRAVLERAIIQLEKARKPEALAMLRLLALHLFEDNPEMVTWIQRRFTFMHDFLLENSIMYKELVQEGREQGIEIGREQGIATGREQGLRQSVEAVVQTRFPALLELSREKVAYIQDAQKLREVLVAMSAATTERKARRYLLALRERE